MKHTPATPLPWFYSPSVDLEEWLPIIATQPDEGQGEVYATQEGIVGAFHSGFKPNASDAAYIAHACNAYPKLVDALKDAIATTPPDSAFLASRVALLRDLGESE